MLYSHLGARKKNLTNNHPPLPAALAPVAQAISNIWANTTWASRASLMVRLQQHCDTNNLHHLPFGAQAAAMVSSLTNVQIQGKYSYAKTFRALASRLAIPTPLLDMYIASLRVDGATIPTSQAVPASRAQARFLIQQALREEDVFLAAVLYLMWKTASRLDDVLHLKKESLIYSDSTCFVIEWGQTKTSRGDPFRVSGWTVIEELLDPFMLDWIPTVFSRLRGQEPLTTITYTQFMRFLRRFPETNSLSAHSFKRGAIGVLIEAAMQGKLEPRLVPIMAKHKDPLHDFPVTTLRYAPNKVHLASLLGTQHATRLL